MNREATGTAYAPSDRTLLFGLPAMEDTIRTIDCVPARDYVDAKMCIISPSWTI
jgi:hypothetical protein